MKEIEKRNHRIGEYIQSLFRTIDDDGQDTLLLMTGGIIPGTGGSNEGRCINVSSSCSSSVNVRECENYYGYCNGSKNYNSCYSTDDDYIVIRPIDPGPVNFIFGSCKS